MFNLQTVNDMEGFDSTKGGFNGTILHEGSGGGGEGTDNYNDLSNKPKINGHTLSGNKSASDLELASAEDLEGKMDTPEAAGTEGQVLTLDENGNPVWEDPQGGGDTSFDDLGYSPFSETETYAAGDVVIYGGLLYKFTAAHTGAWTGTDATATSVEELINEGGGGNGHSPYIGQNGNWYEWDDATQQFVDTGTKAQGEDGEQGPQGEQGQLGPQGPQGPQGNPGSSVDYPFELVNNLTTDDATKALSAAQGKVLGDKFTHQETRVVNLNELPDDYFKNKSESLYINTSTLKWDDNNLINTSRCFSVKAGDRIRITRGAISSKVAILTADDTRTRGDTAAFSSVEGFTTLISSSSITGSEPGASGILTVPSDGAYFYYVTKISSGVVDTTFEYITDFEVKGLDDVVREYDDLDFVTQFGLSVKAKESGGNYPGSVDFSNIYRITNFVDVSRYVGKKLRFIGMLSNNELSVGYAFYNSKSFARESVVEAHVFGTDETLVGPINVPIEVVVPEGAMYFVTSVRDYGNLEESFSIKVPSYLAEFTEVFKKEGDWSKIVHIKPENEGQLNAVKRMRKVTDIEWTPAFGIDRLSTAGGESLFNDRFLQGRQYEGIPYARADQAKYGYAANQFKIGFYISLETFITAAYNRGTVLEVESAYDKTNHRASFYANVCSGTVSAALHHSFMSSSDYDGGVGSAPPAGFSDVGRVSNGFDLNLLRLGDVMSKHDTHTVMVTDVIKDKNGTIKYIEVSENTTAGNGNFTVIGSEFGGVARRLWWNANDDFYTKWDGYWVLRYGAIAGVPYIPSPYVSMPDEHKMDANYFMACLPYMGNGFRYVLVNGQIPSGCGKIVVEISEKNGQNRLHISKKVNGEWADYDNLTIDYTSYDSDNHPYVYVNLPSDMGVGEYSAYVCKFDGGVETFKSKQCNWSVVNSLTMLDDY